MMVSFCAVLLQGVLDEILDLLDSVSEGFPTYAMITVQAMNLLRL